MTPILLLGAVVAGWVLQTVLTYRQSIGFRRETVALKALGTVTVGSGGKRYRGGRAFVALAVDDVGRVRGAKMLRGWTTFARAHELAPVVGHRLGKVAGPNDIPGLDSTERAACREAALLLLGTRSKAQRAQEGGLPTTT